MNHTQSGNIRNAYIRGALGGSLITQIIIGLLLGTLLAIGWPNAAKAVGLLGDLFVKALVAVAPGLVFILVAAAIATHKGTQKTAMGPIILLYIIGTLAAAIVAVVASFLFPQTIHLQAVNESLTPPSNVTDVLSAVLFNIVDNPINALQSANYIGILAWAILLGLTLRRATESSKQLLEDLSNAMSQIVRWIIRLAPIGIFGLVAATIATTGFSALWNYAGLLAVLLGSMIFMALVVNPFIVFLKLKRNPYPLVFTCLKESGVTAFFTRSSAANIPVNLALARRLNLDENTYAISIPLGATINMAGAAITITVLTLAAVNTLQIPVDIPTAILLSIVAAISACGASGVAGGSLLLIPLASSLFGIPNELAMQVVGVGFIIGVIQDSAETALNSSTDVLFTAAATLPETSHQASNA